MMSPELRVLGVSERLPKLPETEYSLCLAPNCTNELATILFSSLKAGSEPYIENAPNIDLAVEQGVLILLAQPILLTWLEIVH